MDPHTITFPKNCYVNDLIKENVKKKEEILVYWVRFLFMQVLVLEIIFYYSVGGGGGCGGGGREGVSNLQVKYGLIRKRILQYIQVNTCCQLFF